MDVLQIIIKMENIKKSLFFRLVVSAGSGFLFVHCMGWIFQMLSSDDTMVVNFGVLLLIFLLSLTIHIIVKQIKTILK